MNSKRERVYISLYRSDKLRDMAKGGKICHMYERVVKFYAFPASLDSARLIHINYLASYSKLCISPINVNIVLSFWSKYCSFFLFQTDTITLPQGYSF